MRVQVQERSEPTIECDGLLNTAAAGEVPQQSCLFGKCIDQTRHPAHGSEQNALQHQIVDAVEQQVAIADRVYQVGDAAHVLRRLFDGNEVFLFRQLGEHFGRDIHAVGDRIVVTEDRQTAGAGNRAEMRQRFSRIGLVDHRRQHHQSGDAEPFGIGGEPAGQGRGTLGHAAQQRHSASHQFHGGPEHI